MSSIDQVKNINLDDLKDYYGKYSVPRDVEEGLDRVRINVTSRIAYYAIFFPVFYLFAFAFVESPMKLVAVTVLGIAGAIASYILPPKFELEKNITLLCYCGAGLFALLLFVGFGYLPVLFWTLGLWALAAVAHAVFRPVKAGDKVMDAIKSQ